MPLTEKQQAVFDAAKTRFKEKFPDFHFAYAQVVDLAEREFAIRCEGIDENDPRFPEEGGVQASICILDRTLKFATRTP